ncbi:tRNA (N(6)-L-threonylcarbamoyladenosine(37)-C(2))-methylthiotransferase MtaB [Aureibacter tunicatorum]|uniref:Threonylcarbamoyladenosine tRNA methylthiotransferase MtaB n=1 Tax=Aureibacter tunicatorum TaxID=866807 RepID=A0AAE3XME6_9BACT|nr:tRNA (N(6)-L-threonylcarbamoyladenosine(37)-C(2))-methylthiotransferase MtaB [Aureibacter tunicatorum]MDR6239268.1 threonylcarbamoyladenosine tRNA methylthiotransferase MtaB [Aureibacter tunicatorum]BDD04807.1 tRNA (N(6)-L-threonylcarbamoyladenosine(37)-C(2))-methylthiotransferase MtaB [Aureibacter tunicatorum]
MTNIVEDITKQKVAFYTLGCKLNFSETSSISRIFEARGYEKVEFTDTPDIFVINTCSVTDNADKKCKRVVKEALKISPEAYIVIIGCYAQLKPKEIAEIPGVDAVLGAAEKFKLIDVLDGFEKKYHPETNQKEAKVFASEIKEATAFNNAFSINDRTRTFLKVQDGCDYSCTFCTIPLARGNSRSDSIANVIKSAKEIASSGVKEIVLTGVNTGDFGIQDGKRVEKFIDLIKELDLVDGIERIRISSIEPNLLSDEIIEFCATSNKFVPHFHIPLQSGSDKVLSMMRRRYKSDLYTKRVQKIKELITNCCIGVDVIVGFPGESHEDFLDTYNYLNELDVSYFHVFTYSERDNTLATEMENIVPQKERNERSKMLRILSEKKKRHFYESQLGNDFTVLFEDDIEDGMIHGFTENYVRVCAKYDPLLINETKAVTLDKVSENGTVEVKEIEQTYETH